MLAGCALAPCLNRLPCLPHWSAGWPAQTAAAPHAGPALPDAVTPPMASKPVTAPEIDSSHLANSLATAAPDRAAITPPGLGFAASIASLPARPIIVMVHAAFAAGLFVWWLAGQFILLRLYLTASPATTTLVGLFRELALPALAIGDRRSNLYRRIVMLVQTREPLVRRCSWLWNLEATVVAVVFIVIASGLRLDAGILEPDAVSSSAVLAQTSAPAPSTSGKVFTCRVSDKNTGKPIAGAKGVVRLSRMDKSTHKDHDIKGIEVLHYEAPIVAAQVVSEDGPELKNAQVSAEYFATKAEMRGKFILERGVRSDVAFEAQTEGWFRSSMLFPDEEFQLTAAAEGFEPSSEILSLHEGVIKELTFTLKRKNPAPKIERPY
jgi:hypothetical protein